MQNPATPRGRVLSALLILALARLLLRIAAGLAAFGGREGLGRKKFLVALREREIGLTVDALDGLVWHFSGLLFLGAFYRLS